MSEHDTSSTGSPISDGLRLVGTYARSHPTPFAIAVFGSVLYAFGSVASAFTLGWATDNVLIPLYEPADGVATRTGAAIALIIGVMVLRSVGVIARRYFAGMTAARVRADMQRDVADRLVAVPVDRVRTRPPGELLAHLDSDTTAAIEVLHPLPFTIGVLSMIGFAIVGLARLDIPLMLTTIGVLPIVGLMSWVSSALLEKPTVAERAANANVTAAASEIVAGTQVIKTLGREDAELERFAGVVDVHRRSRIRLQSMHTIIDNTFAFIPQLAMVLIVVVGTTRVDAGALEPGGLVEAVALFGVLAFPMQVIGFFLTDLPVSVVGRRRVEAVIDEPDDSLRFRRGLPLGTGPLPVSLRDVWVGGAPDAGGSSPAGSDARLRGVTLEVDAGETIALVGPTASGKSTVLEVLARLRRHDSGAVAIDATPINEIDDAALRTRVTLASQQAVLRTGTVMENADFGRDRSAEELLVALRTAGGAELESDLPEGFDTVVGERGVTLSGGQRQRVALARALAGDPGLILLDDATSAVDPAVEEEILTSLAALDTTVLMVTHRVAAMAAADRVALMVDGRVEAVAPHTDLLDNERYRSLVEAYRAGEAAHLETADVATAGGQQ